MLKKKALRKAVVAILSLILCAGCFGTISFAENEGIEEEAVQLFEVLDNPTDYLSEEAKQVALQETGDLPGSFDLRSVDTDGDGEGDRCYVAPVRSQYPFGTCWGFASIAAAETNILSTQMDEYPDAWKELDLSEKQIAYFSHIWLDDPNSPQNGEGMYSPNGESLDELTAEDIYVGGSAFLAANTFATGIGPVFEARDELYEYKGKNGIIQEAYEENGIMFPDSYSKNDDWLLDESYRYQQDFVMADSYLLPCPAIYDKDNNFAYQYNEAGTMAIKENLFGRNAVVIGFCADTSRPWQTQTEGEYMNAKTWAHYTWKTDAANHAVTIIGWDDSYSKENFPAEHQPPEDGAWLVKNSWGSGENEFPNKGSGTWGLPVPKTDESGNVVLDGEGNPVMVGSGYFWLSYYDQSISNPEVLLFDEWLNGAGTRYDPETLHRDQHDLMPVTSINALKSPELAKTANVFTPEKREEVVSIAYEVATPGTVVNYEIYLLPPDALSPEDGVLMASGSRTHIYGGYYQEYLEEPLIIQEGQRYSIIITETLEDGCFSINTPIAFAKNPFIAYGKAVVNEGESLLYVNGTWQDWTRDEPRAAIFAGDWDAMRGNVALDNFPIKGIAYDSPLDIGVRRADQTAADFEVAAGNTADLNLEIFGTDQSFWNAEDCPVEWIAAGDGSRFITVTPSDDGLTAEISGLEPGKTLVAAKVKEVGTVLIPVTVYDVPIREITLDRTSAEIAATSALQLNVRIDPADATDTELVWESSNTDVATVDQNGTVTGITRGTATITVASKTDETKTAACAVTVKFDDAYYNLDGTGQSNVTKGMEKAIYWAADKKITGEKVSFGTNNSMTRGQFVRFLYRYAGNPKVTSSMIKKYGSQFKDVDKNYTHYKAIVWAVSEGLIGGYSDGSFKPNGTLSRKNMATILWKFAGAPKVSNASKPFTDVASSTAIAWGKNKKIFTGTKFQPNANCLRGDFAVFLYRYDRKK